MKQRAAADHYSYRVYADAATAEAFDERRFGGPIGNLVAAEQADVLQRFAGQIRDRRILDVGTGTGRAAFLMARGGARVTGVDSSEEMLTVARRHAADQQLAIQFQRGDVHHLEFADRSFDVVISLRVLMHTPDWRQALAELCRVSARLVIVDYPSAASFAALQAMARRATHALGANTEPYRVLRAAAVAQAFEVCGFQIPAAHRQFVLPIALHKAIGSRSFTVQSRKVSERLGLLNLFGSPVTLLAERCAS